MNDYTNQKSAILKSATKQKFVSALAELAVSAGISVPDDITYSQVSEGGGEDLDWILLQTAKVERLTAQIDSRAAYSAA